MNKKQFIALFYIIGFTFISLFYSCEKDPEIIIQTETITDTLIITDTLTVIDTLIIVDTLIETIIETLSDTATTFILVKHAEKITSGATNPDLTAEGHERALELSRVLENVSLDAVFATNYNRTIQTVEPTAISQGLVVQLYETFGLDPLVNRTLFDYHEGVVLVVGHSNTIPFLLNILVGEDVFPELPETEHDNIYIVTVFEKGRSSVVQLKYGE